MAPELLKMHKLRIIFMACGCGVASVGGSRTSENSNNSNDLHGLGAGGGRGPAPVVGWGLLVARELLKMHKIHLISLVLGCGAGGTGAPEL